MAYMTIVNILVLVSAIWLCFGYSHTSASSASPPEWVFSPAWIICLENSSQTGLQEPRSYFSLYMTMQVPAQLIYSQIAVLCRECLDRATQIFCWFPYIRGKVDARFHYISHEKIVNSRTSIVSLFFLSFLSVSLGLTRSFDSYIYLSSYTCSYTHPFIPL